MSQEEFSFEKSMNRLEELVNLLGDDSVPLNQFISLLKESKELQKKCLGALESAIQEIQVIDKNYIK